MTRVRDKSDGFTVLYPQALEFERQQQEVMWFADEIAVEDDINDLRVHTTESERHGILHVLKLFTLYEFIAGDEYWSGRFREMFPRVEFIRMGSQFAQVELCVHMPFYNKINEVLFINTPEFYEEWKYDDVLSKRMEFIQDKLKDDSFNGLLSLAAFSMIEGAVLYSSFAFLKSFKKHGRNLIPNIVSGINFSVRDESLHAQAGAWAFRVAAKEEGLNNDPKLHNEIMTVASTVFDHECRIVDQIFEKGPIEGIHPIQLKHFVAHRVNMCLSNLGVGPVFLGEDTSVADWFYEDITGTKSTDHFATLSSNYSRNWKESKFYY